MGYSKFLPHPLCSSVLISLINFIWDTHTTHEVIMCYSPFPGQKVKGQDHTGHLKFSSCLLHGFLLIWPNHFICGMHAYIQDTRGQLVMHHFQDERSSGNVTGVISSFGPLHSVAFSLFGWITSYVAYIQHMRWQCVMHHFQVQRSRSHRSFKVLTLSAPCLFDLITIYVAYIQHMRWRCVMHHIQVQRSRSHRSFKVKALSAPWLHPYLTESLYMWHTYNTWGDNVSRNIFSMKGQRWRAHGLFIDFTFSTSWFPPYCLVEWF